MDWDREGRDWPNREASRFVQSGGMRWHVQSMGSGPTLLLVHGTGAATHSWRDLAPLLARDFTVVAPDLPGHGFSDALPSGQPTLPAMASALRALLDTLAIEPEFALGHSAGAAIVARLALDAALVAASPLRGWVSINGALLPLPGLPGVVFRPIARVLALNPLTSRVFAWRAADTAAVERLIASTGSRLDPAGVEWYRRVVRRPDHVRGALAMMAHWDLRSLQRDLPGLRLPALLITGAHDRTVPCAESARAGSLLANSEILEMPGLGHLAHEEQPEATAQIIRSWATGVGTTGN